jgi:hypothetical protein
MSNSLHDESSEPVPKAFPSGKNCTELISDSCPGNDFTAPGSRISHNLAVASQLPDTKIFLSGNTETDITSPVCSENEVFACFDSISHRMHVESPEEVIISSFDRNLQHERYPSCPASSQNVLVACGFGSARFNLYMEQILSSPPQATNCPSGEYAQVITHEDLSGIACTLLVENAFHTINFPS